ncbi:hypothetical protein BDY19DRAFT_960861 [Irpex rosettiformis]|uniref:Uncharacterized protein n=1 Tax=Irpex rosettiformis TaxID=378272 RepID=A0ACB8TWC7_9APHY|nr:hypothetical protein BDY19DRAFT_960861 [Irpex rosettiformis]
MVPELNNKHHLLNNSSDSQPEIHVFTLMSVSPFNNNMREIHIVIPRDPVQIILRGNVKFSGDPEVDLLTYISVPFLPQCEIGSFKGKLLKDSTIKVGVPLALAEIAVGDLYLFHGTHISQAPNRSSKAGSLSLQGDLTIFGKKQKFTISLFPIPEIKTTVQEKWPESDLAMEFSKSTRFVGN